ncbi:MAG: chemotaxis protein CheW [Ectothiorhodospiraceae bacterium]|nr:chemotaxis protein CheW [Ectothiorhodospiraceae bacterium]
MNRSENTAARELVDSRDAVWHYLDALLQDIPEESGPAAVEQSPPADALRVESAQRPAALAQTRSLFREESRADPVVAPAETGQPLRTIDAPAVESRPEPQSEPLPEWRAREFQALFFYVGGLRLAVPLTELHSVVSWGDVDVTAMPNQPAWFMGLMPYRDRKVRVIDTAAMVLPENKRSTPEAQAAPAHILVVGDGSWGLVCHGIGDVIRLQPDEVKWRSGQGKRRWLAGTVIGHLSALVDTDAFADMLDGRGSTSPAAGR